MTITSLLDRASRLKVLVVGDGIVDEYVYVKPQGRSPKESIITYKILRSERFQGGVWAAAKHVEGFCAKADCVSGSPVTTKSRRIEEGPYYVKKVHEEHSSESAEGWKWRDPAAYDVVIITDFGHGAVKDWMIRDMTDNAKFLAVNAQTNSANIGFNLITKYKRADYVVIDELEARLAAHDRDSPIEDVIRKLGFPKIIVTLGQYGSIGFDGSFYKAPAVSSKVVDTMGAGDAFFCVTAPLAAAGADIDTLCRIGNAAGAIKCGIVGHRKAVTCDGLLDRLETDDLLVSQR